MPTYDYQCPCGMQFAAFAILKDALKPKKCPLCAQDTASRIVPFTLSASFTQEVTGPEPQNTGIHDLDTHIDRVIGQSAKQGWGVAQQRHDAKVDILAQNPDVTGHDLGRTEDGGYRVMTPEEKSTHQKLHSVHDQALTELQRRKSLLKSPR